MSHPLRLRHPGALYHITARGKRRVGVDLRAPTEDLLKRGFKQGSIVVGQNGRAALVGRRGI